MRHPGATRIGAICRCARFIFPCSSGSSIYLASTVYPPRNLDCGQAHRGAFCRRPMRARKRRSAARRRHARSADREERIERGVAEYGRTQQPWTLHAHAARRAANRISWSIPRGERVRPAKAHAEGDRRTSPKPRREGGALRCGVSGTGDHAQRYGHGVLADRCSGRCSRCSSWKYACSSAWPRAREDVLSTA